MCLPADECGLDTSSVRKQETYPRLTQPQRPLEFTDPPSFFQCLDQLCFVECYESINVEHEARELATFVDAPCCEIALDKIVFDKIEPAHLLFQRNVSQTMYSPMQLRRCGDRLEVSDAGRRKHCWRQSRRRTPARRAGSLCGPATRDRHLREPSKGWHLVAPHLRCPAPSTRVAFG
jgi:hypothetical protein